MKKFYLIRHAKSSWEDISQKDIDRPLNERGKRNAPQMAKRLKEQGVQPDLIISSPAVRARTTAEVFCVTLEYPLEKLRIDENIYEAYIDDILKIIYELPNDKELVMLFGHNPTFTNLSNYFSTDYIPNVPTCGMVCIEANVENWSDINAQNSKVVSFEYPKMMV